MEYLALVRPPRPEVAALVEGHMAPLRRLRAAGGDGAWWRAAAVVDLAAGALQEACFCVLDGFLPPQLAEQLAEGVWGSRPVGPVGAEGKNGWTRGGTARAAEAIQSGGGLEERNERLARALLNPSRGDVALFSDGDHHLPGTCALCAAVDELVDALGSCPAIAQRLAHTDFANSAMFTVYPGGASRYIKHTDNSALTDGRRLTAILYLNKVWEPSHGGQLRIFEPTMQSVQFKADIEPLFNRLVLFWSTEEVPHEVLPSYRERAAVSIWYCCARECLQTEEAFKRLACRARCIAGRSRADRLEAAGWTPEQRRLLRLLGEPPSPGAAPEESAAGREREAVRAAVLHDFGGCEAHRRQRERLSRLFGWDARAAEAQRQASEAQRQQRGLFEALGLPLPAPLEAPAPRVPQTSAPALAEELCRRSAGGGAVAEA
ncbi:unnamed protein product [Prorocentrum cordatum]|uniref:Fe2OG dioxygenase domain-containing protein n=1 Tax=Prorocentrum cordatum TaxID=2364126 RepID=A0ABN9XT95_9DINO|nr:unnamed protein product [Polarella glacialis]